MVADRVASEGLEHALSSWYRRLVGGRRDNQQSQDRNLESRVDSQSEGGSTLRDYAVYVGLGLVADYAIEMATTIGKNAPYAMSYYKRELGGNLRAGDVDKFVSALVYGDIDAYRSPGAEPELDTMYKVLSNVMTYARLYKLDDTKLGRGVLSASRVPLAAAGRIYDRFSGLLGRITGGSSRKSSTTPAVA